MVEFLGRKECKSQCRGGRGNASLTEKKSDSLDSKKKGLADIHSERENPALRSGGDLVVTVFVKNAEGSEIASRLSGYFVIQGREFPFKGIAFGRIGGHNASVNLSKKVLDEISKIGID